MADPSERLQPNQGKFADIKARLQTLPLAERVALEVRLAKELGIVITPEQLISIASPTTGRSRNDDIAPPGSEGRQGAIVPTSSAWGGVDMDARAGVAATLKAMGLGSDLDAGSVREAIRRLDEPTSGAYGSLDLAGLIAGLHDRLELLAARGDHPELVAQGRASLARAVFAAAAAADPSKPGPGGAPNR